MNAIPLHEVTVDMNVVISTPGEDSLPPMLVKGVTREEGVGWQETITLFLVDHKGRNHTMVAGIKDFLKSGNQIFAVA